MTYEPLICPICKTQCSTMRDLAIHLLVICLLDRHDKRKDGNFSYYFENGFYMRRKCFCGKVLEYDMARNGETAIQAFKDHICGRELCGIRTESLTYEDVKAWGCYHLYLLNLKEAK